MKTINFFKSLALIVFLAMSLSSFAQITAPSGYTLISAASETVDFVTKGSVMPYEVTPDANISALVSQSVLKLSVYGWAVTGASNTLTKQTGGALDAAPAPDAATHFQQNQVGISFPATGTYSVSVTEKSQSNIAGISGCEGASKTVSVIVTNKPTVAWPATSTVGGCGVAGTTINVPVNLTGTDQWEVTYKIDYTDLNNVTTSFQASTIKTIAGTTALSATTYANTESNATLHAIAIPAATYGTYIVTITNISDRILRKSFASAAFSNVAGTEYPSIVYKVFSLPTPTTGDVKHIKTF